MKSVIVSIIITVLLVGCGVQHPDTSPIKRSLEEKMGQFTNAFNKQDINGLMQDYWNSPDLAVYYPDGNYIGYDAVKKSWENFFGSASVKKFSITELHTEVDADGEVAYQWGLFDLVYQPKGGPEVQAPGRFLEVWRNMNGRWQLVVDHASSLLPPQPTPIAAP